MRLAAFSVVLFIFAFGVHWMIWRIRLPERQTRALLTTFLGTLIAGLAVLVWMPQLHAPAPPSIWPLVQVTLFHVGVALAYIIVYSTLEAQSPALALVKYVADAGDQGRTHAELTAHLAAGQTLRSRLEAMQRDGLLTAQDGNYRLTDKGVSWVRVFGMWRRLLNIDVGG